MLRAFGVPHLNRRQPLRSHLPVREVRAQLERVFASPDFDGSRRSRELLQFIVEESLAGRADAITQPMIATRVFGRKDDFDAVVDPIVRIQAGRLRRSLERYYLLSGAADPVRIELPKGAYAAAFRTVAASASAGNEFELPEVTPADDWPAVTVSVFLTSRQRPELAESAEHLCEVLATELIGYRLVRVVPRGQPERREPLQRRRARFGLGGSLRRRGDILALTACLVDRSTGEQVWGSEYQAAVDGGPERPGLEDVARIVAARVASEEGVLVRLLAAERRHGKPTKATTYDAILGACDFFLRRDTRTVPDVVRALRGAVAADPDCGLAWTLLARLYLANHVFDAAPIPTPLDQALGYAQTGVRLDPTSRVARSVLGGSLIFKGEVDGAREELDHALELSPGSLVYLDMIGWLLTLCGDWERGSSLVRTALEHNSSCVPQTSIALWVAALKGGDFEAAYRAALAYRDSAIFWRATMRACCLGHLGRGAEARAEVAELLQRKPDFKSRGVALLGRMIKFPELMERIVEGLAKAGLRLREPGASSPRGVLRPNRKRGRSRTSSAPPRRGRESRLI
jgi:adenylate cyclase